MAETGFFHGKKVLVAGGAGFVGTNIIFRLLDSGAYVRATLHNKPPQINDSRIEFLQGDLRDEKFTHLAAAGIDYVFMCAANTSGAAVIERTPLAHVTPNVIMNALMLKAAYEAGVKKFLWISSSIVYPVTDHAVSEDEVVFGDLFHKYFFAGWMKQFGEVLCEMYAKRIGNPMPVVVVRPANLYGEYDDFEWETSHMVAALVRRVVERHNPIVVWGDGNDIKDLLYIGDFVDGVLAAMEKIDTFNPVNIATGKAVITKDVLNSLIEVDNYKDAGVRYDKTKPTMIPKRLMDIGKAERILGFKAKTSLKVGLKRTIDWYRERRMFRMEGIDWSRM